VRVLLDANLPRSASRAVTDAGHDATDVRDIGMRAATDAEIARYAHVNHFCITTRDFDFADIRNYPPSDYDGLIVLDLPEDALSRDVCSLLSTFLRRTDIESVMPQRLAIVRVDRVRFRPKLSD
jgi:hypothetical protein